MKMSKKKQSEDSELPPMKGPKPRKTRGVCPNAVAFKAIRHELRLLREAVAVYSEVSVTTVRKMETGRPVDAKSVAKVAKRFSDLTGRDIAIDDLIEKSITAS